MSKERGYLAFPSCPESSNWRSLRGTSSLYYHSIPVNLVDIGGGPSVDANENNSPVAGDSVVFEVYSKVSLTKFST